MRRSNQPSYEATDVGYWSFVSSNEPVKNGYEVIYDHSLLEYILIHGFQHYSIVSVKLGVAKNKINVLSSTENR